MPSVRRLTAILAADVAGYSRLMGEDEEGTLERLQMHLSELINPKITEHQVRAGPISVYPPRSLRAPNPSTTTRVCRSKRRAIPTPFWPGRKTASCWSISTARQCVCWYPAGQATGQ